jgi:predicted phage terminase large subunit-like protein
LIEDTGIGPALIAKLRACGFSTTGVKPEGSKQARMSMQSTKFADGRVHLPDRAPSLNDFEAELFAFPGSRHDDQIDSCGQALAHKRTVSRWTERSTVGLANFYRGLGARM